MNMLDCTGKHIQVGDIVLRASYSNITFHRIVKINVRSVKLTRGSREVSYGSGSYLVRNFARNIYEVDSLACNNAPPISVRAWSNQCLSIFKIEENNI